MQTERPFVMTIAGFDSCGGAGVLADIKTFECLNVQGLAVITANTTQTENSDFSVDWISLSQVVFQLEKMLQTYDVEVVKIGIVPNVEYLEKIVETIKFYRPEAKIVWDTVLRSSSGTVFFKEEDFATLHKILLNIDLITPNALEYQVFEDNNILPRDKTAILLKGGHRKDAVGEDLLYAKQGTYAFQKSDRKVYDKHGSGCVLSSAIVAYWAKEKDLVKACEKAKVFIEQYLASSKGLLGKFKSE